MDAEKTGKLKRFLVPAAIVLVLCLLWLLLRPYFARDGQRYDGSKSALRYEIIADWEAKPADHLYVYAADAPEDMQKQMLERYGTAEKLAALLPVHTPEHPQYRGEGKDPYFVYLIRRFRDRINGEIFVYPNTYSGKYEISTGVQEIDWQGIAGYTSPEAPLYLYKEGLWYFGIIGDRAYCLTLRESYQESIGVNTKTDNFVPYPGGVVRDVPINEAE